MSSSVTLKASGLQIQANQLSLPEGALTVASNVVINRDNIIEKRRGFNLYGNSFGTSSDVLKQLMEYRNRLIRHYVSTLEYDDGNGNFVAFPGSFTEPQTGTRIKSIAMNNNFYFTTSDGIEKISSASSDLGTAVISNAGGVKAIDMSATLNYTYGSSSGFLPQDSAVAYRAVWGITDPNNNLILGTPSPRAVVYNPLTPLMTLDFAHLTAALDNATLQPGSQALTDTNYSSSFPIDSTTDAADLRTDLIGLAQKLDLDIYPALPTIVSTKSFLPGLATATFDGTSSTIAYTFSSPHGLVVGDSITISNVNPGGYNGNFTVATVPSSTIVIVSESIDPGAYVSGGSSGTDNWKNLQPLSFVAGPPASIKVLFNSTPALSIGNFVMISGVTPTSYNGNYVVSFVDNTNNFILVTPDQTSATATTLTDPGLYVTSGTNPVTRIKYQAITEPGVLTSPETDQSLVAVQTYMQTIITTLQTADSNGGVPDISNANLAAYIDGLNITTTASVDVSVNIPQDVIDAGTNEYFLQVYRSDITQATDVGVLSDLVPDDEMRLIFEGFPTSAQLTAGTMKFNDNTPDAFAGAFLYTNQSTGEGILQANDPPPYAIDIARFKNVAFYANTKRKQSKIISLLGVGNMIDNYNNGIIPKLTITNGTDTVTYAFVNGINQITQVQLQADVANSLNGKYFDYFTANDARTYRFYYKTSGGTDNPPTITTQILTQIPINTGSSAVTVAGRTNEFLNFYTQDFSSIVTIANHTVLNITNTDEGYTTTASAGTTPFTMTILTSGQGESTTTNPKQVLLSNSPSSATAIDETARSLIDVINKDPNSPVYAFYISTENSVPGQIEFEARDLGSDTIYFLAGDNATGNSFNPSLSPSNNITVITPGNPTILTTPSPHLLNNAQVIIIAGSNSPISIDGKYAVTVVNSTQFSIPLNTIGMTPGSYHAVYSGPQQTVSTDNETKINRLYFSKLQQPEAVPLINYLNVGDSDKAILRIYPLRDSLFIFKEEGLYRVSGEVAPFTLALFDSSVILVGQDSLGVVSNRIFAWTKKNIETIDESGSNLVSRPIDNVLLQLASSNFPNFKSATFGVGYESDKSYLVWTVQKTTDTAATIAYRYSTVTGAWTTYDKTDTCGIIKLLEDKLFLGAGDTNFMEQERKTFTRTDYADRELSFDLTTGNYNGVNITFSSIVGMAVGDALVQEQTLSSFTYNMLLKKLDIDPGSNSTTRFATLQSVPGDDMRLKLTALASNLDSSSLGFTNYSSLIASKTGSIGAQTLGGPVVNITSTAHGLQTGRYITISGNTSTPSLNGDWIVTVINANTFSIPTSVTTSSSTGTFVTIVNDFQDLQGCYNILVGNLNGDPVISFTNYETITFDTIIEALITDIDTITKTITVSSALPYIVGALTVFKAFDSTVRYAQITMGDPLGIKHMREATVMFDNMAFTQATVSFASDLIPSFDSISFNGDGNGIFGIGTGNFGAGFFGGASNTRPLRTYIPRYKQRCRTLSVKFDHTIARENIMLYGITVTGEVGLSTRAYRA